jgi:VCBS repeat-containing protein
MPDGLSDALGRFNKSASATNPEANDTDKAGKDEKSETSVHGHHHQVHVHKDGTHHYTVHHGGQMVHHSEHGSLEEAAEEMKKHG